MRAHEDAAEVCDTSARDDINGNIAIVPLRKRMRRTLALLRAVGLSVTWVRRGEHVIPIVTSDSDSAK